MEWLEAMLKSQDPQHLGEELIDDEDFYGDGGMSAPAAPTATAAQHTLPEAAQDVTGMTPNNAKLNVLPTPGSLKLSPSIPFDAQTAEQRKLENQRKAEQLRAKLIANRQNTPIRANTPNKMLPKVETPQENAPIKDIAEKRYSGNGDHVVQQSEPSSDALGIEALLQEGKAAAEAKAKAEDAAKADASSTIPPSTRAGRPTWADIVRRQQQQQQQQQRNDHEQEQQQQQQEQNQEHSNIHQPEKLENVPVTVENGIDHATEYYADLSVWLEVTGYHDIQYRNAKLQTYKKRKALEEEAARIQEKLEKLKYEEQTEMQVLRAGSLHPVATPSRPPPALPTFMQTADTTKPAAKNALANGTKRAHSPEPMLAEKNARQREDSNPGIRIRGANDSPQDRSRTFGRDRAGSPPGRRVSYPDARHQNSYGDANGRQSRDPSLERRQAYYGRDGDGARGRERYEPPAPPRENGGRGRMGFSAVNAPQDRIYRDSYPAPPRGIRDVDTGRGANVRYFMIKSWNAENVAAAMRDSLWSTQVKNEGLLADAYQASRAVVLCFSVNNSKAFQGYAVMTSPPSPNLPKPAFCAKLNWSTSSAFTLNWLATAPVHFRHVGHIKNPLNVDDEGRPSAVLVGKDGQEIAAEAGRALCEILDEVMGAEGAGVGGGGKGGGRGR